MLTSLVKNVKKLKKMTKVVKFSNLLKDLMKFDKNFWEKYNL